MLYDLISNWVLIIPSMRMDGSPVGNAAGSSVTRERPRPEFLCQKRGHVQRALGDGVRSGDSGCDEGWLRFGIFCHRHNFCSCSNL